MTDTTPALDLDAITEKWLRQCGACDAGLAMSCTCPPGDPRNVIDALVTEAATLRRDLAEARRERAAEYDRGCATAAEELVTLRRERDSARTSLDLAWASLNRLTAGLLNRGWTPAEGDAVTGVLALLDTARRERDEAVAETARVRTVYRDALARWRDELTQLRKAVTTIAARRERERPDDIIVDALRAALDGAATPTEDARS